MDWGPLLPALPPPHVIITAAGMIFWLARKYERGVDMCRRALDLVPDFSLGRWALAMILSQKGMHDAAIAEMEDLVRKIPAASVRG